MLDKVLVNIISTTIGAIGLIGAITKYDFPKAKRNVFGENLFRIKEDTINNYVTWSFTIYAVIGLLFQLITNDIFGNDIPDRLYSTDYYFLALGASLILIISLVPFIKLLGRWVAKDKWRPEIINKAKDNFILAREILETNQSLTDNPQVIKIVEWLEELLEAKSPKKDLKSRLEFFEPFFK